MLHIGHYHYIQKSKVLAITGIESAPLKRAKSNAADKNKLIDCTTGRATESLIFLNDGYVVASSLTTETLYKRMEGKTNE